jgi:hypothetical protein
MEHLGGGVSRQRERGTELDFGLSGNIGYNRSQVSPPEAELRYWRGLLAL